MLPAPGRLRRRDVSEVLKTYRPSGQHPHDPTYKSSREVVKVASDFVGLAVNVAARLCDMTEPGEVTIENACYRQAARTRPLPLLEQRRVSVRGVSKPLSVRVAAAPRVPWLP